MCKIQQRVCIVCSNEVPPFFDLHDYSLLIGPKRCPDNKEADNQGPEAARALGKSCFKWAKSSRKMKKPNGCESKLCKSMIQPPEAVKITTATSVYKESLYRTNFGLSARAWRKLSIQDREDHRDNVRKLSLAEYAELETRYEGSMGGAGPHKRKAASPDSGVVDEDKKM